MLVNKLRRYSTITILGVIVLYGCKNDQEVLKSECAKSIRKEIEDYAFKNNFKAQIFDLKVLKVDTVSRAVVDKQLGAKAINQIKSYQSIQELTISQMKGCYQQAKLYTTLGSLDLAQMKMDEGKDYKSQLLALNDTVDHLFEYDSLVTLRAKSYRAGDVVYSAKTFLKATETVDGHSRNMADTFYYYLDKSYRVFHINIPEYPYQLK